MAASRSRRMGSDVNLTAPAPGPVARQRMLPPPNAVTLTWISPPWCWQSRCTVTWRVPAANRTRAVGTVMEASWPYCSNTRVECGSRGYAEANRCGFFTSAHELAHTAITASTEVTEHTRGSLTLPPSRALCDPGEPMTPSQQINVKRGKSHVSLWQYRPSSSACVATDWRG